MYIETLSHHAADAYDEMVVGDAAMEEIYKVRQNLCPALSSLHAQLLQDDGHPEQGDLM